jgi:integrase
VNGDHLNGRWRSLLAKLGLEHRSLYQTRSTFITMALRMGMPVQDVARLAGNEAYMTLKHYAGISRDLRLPEM